MYVLSQHLLEATEEGHGEQGQCIQTWTQTLNVNATSVTAGWNINGFGASLDMILLSFSQNIRFCPL
jgi:hypothetical protein